MESRNQARTRTGTKRTGDEGQAVVEAAIVLPAMIMLIVCMIQLTMIQHARIMTDYAAFCAARAGIVFNGDKNAMTRAAEIALLPTLGRTDTLAALTRTALSTATIERAQRAPFNLPYVRVDILAPTRSVLNANLTRHLGGNEIDFDDIRSEAARANLLSVKVRYMYRMPIPFANQLLLNIFFASRMNMLSMWEGFDMTRPELRGTGQSAVTATSLRALGGANQIAGQGATSRDVQDVQGIAIAALAHRYYFPLEATYTMRMQSNLFRNNLP